MWCQNIISNTLASDGITHKQIMESLHELAVVDLSVVAMFGFSKGSLTCVLNGKVATMERVVVDYWPLLNTVYLCQILSAYCFEMVVYPLYCLPTFLDSRIIRRVADEH